MSNLELDKQIATLFERKHLTESEVRTLCDKVMKS